jgi:hypothetical protein
MDRKSPKLAFKGQQNGSMLGLGLLFALCEWQFNGLSDHQITV